MGSRATYKNRRSTTGDKSGIGVIKGRKMESVSKVRERREAGRVARTHLGSRCQHPKCTERIVKQPLIHILVQIPNEEVGPDVKLFFI